MGVNWVFDKKKKEKGLDPATLNLVKGLDVGNIEEFIRGGTDYQGGKPIPPKEGKFGVRALSTIDYFVGWAVAHNDGRSEPERLHPNDFATGCYEALADIYERKLSKSYKTGYALGENLRSPQTPASESNPQADHKEGAA